MFEIRFYSHINRPFAKKKRDNKVRRGIILLFFLHKIQ